MDHIANVPAFGVLYVDGRACKATFQQCFQQRPWFKELPSEEDASRARSIEDASVKVLRDGAFNVCLSDRAFVSVGFGEERQQTLASQTPAAHSLLARHDDIPMFQLLNHSPHSSVLTDKASVLRCLNRSLTGSRKHVFDSIPTTFYISSTNKSTVLPVLRQFFQRFVAGEHGRQEGERMPEKQCLKNMWIVKPARPNSSGKIFISNNATDLKTHLTSQTDDIVVQKYVERPLLVNGRKVSLRLTVLLCDTGRCYLHRAAFCYTASEEYTVMKPRTWVGDANHYVQEVHVTAQCREPTADTRKLVLTMSELQDYLDLHRSSAFPPQAVTRILLPAAKQIVVDCLRGAGDYFQAPVTGSPSKTRRPKPSTQRWFELLSADFIIDEDLRPWMLGFADAFPDILSADIGEEIVRCAIDPLFTSDVEAAAAALAKVSQDTLLAPAESAHITQWLRYCIDADAVIATGYTATEATDASMKDEDGAWTLLMTNMGHVEEGSPSVARANMRVPTYAMFGPRARPARLAWYSDTAEPATTSAGALQVVNLPGDASASQSVTVQAVKRPAAELVGPAPVAVEKPSIPKHVSPEELMDTIHRLSARVLSTTAPKQPTPRVKSPGKRWAASGGVRPGTSSRPRSSPSPQRKKLQRPPKKHELIEILKSLQQAIQNGAQAQPFKATSAPETSPQASVTPHPAPTAATKRDGSLTTEFFSTVYRTDAFEDPLAVLKAAPFDAATGDSVDGIAALQEALEATSFRERASLPQKAQVTVPASTGVRDSAMSTKRGSRHDMPLPIMSSPGVATISGDRMVLQSTTTSRVVFRSH